MESRSIIIDKDMGIRLLTSYKPIKQDRLTELLIKRKCGNWHFSAKEGEYWKWDNKELENQRLTIIYGLIKLTHKYKWR